MSPDGATEHASIVVCRTFGAFVFVDLRPGACTPVCGLTPFQGLPLEKERLLKPIDEDAGEVAGEGYPCYLLHVPAEGYLLQTHDDDACGRTDDEH